MINYIFKGERYRENIGPKSKTRARELVEKRKTEIRDGLRSVDGKRWIDREWIVDEEKPRLKDILFDDALEKYLGFYKADHRPKSYERHQTSSIQLKKFFGGKKLSQISVLDVQKYKTDRKTSCSCTSGPTKQEGSDRCTVCGNLIFGKADATINRELILLKHLFSMAISWKFAKTNPVKEVKFFRENNGRTRYLSQGEAKTLLAACNADFRIVVLAAMHSGCRSSELKTLRWRCVDFDNNCLTVESCYSKNHETRTVPLSADLAAALSEIHDKREPAADDLVFTHNGRPWRSWRTGSRRRLERAGLNDFHFHDLRHCFGSWLAMSGTALEARMQLMGHKTPSMTARYSHLSPSYKAMAIQKLPTFGAEVLKTDQPQIPLTEEPARVVAFGK